MMLLLFTAPFVQVLLRDFILMILYCYRSTNRRFLLAKDVFRMENGPVLRFNHREIFIPSLCYFLMQREARVISNVGN